MNNNYWVNKLLGSTKYFVLFLFLIGIFFASGIGLAFLLATNNQQPEVLPAQPNLANDDTSTDIGLSANQKLTVNAQLELNGQLSLLPTELPDNAKAGTLVFDQSTNTLQYFNGSNFVSLTSQAPIPPVQNGVTSLQGQSGAVNLVAGTGITINGTTISTNGAGLTAVSGTAGQVNVVTSNGVASISLPQSIAPTFAPTFAGMTLNGDLSISSTSSLFGNNLVQTAPGQDVNVNAGSDNIIFTVGGRTFQLPTTGPVPQTICTQGITCISGGGQSVELAPGSAQTDNTADASIFINDTGGGNLLQLQSSGVNQFVVSGSGNLTTRGNIGFSNGTFTTTLGRVAPIANTTINLPALGAGTYELCTSAGNCAASVAVDSVNSFTGDVDIVGVANQTTIGNSLGTITIGTVQNINTTSSPTFNGISLSSLSVNGDTINDITGTGLVVSGGTLQSTLGVSVDLTSEVNGILPVSSGGLGTGSLTVYSVLLGNGTSAPLQITAGGTGECLVSTAGAPAFAACPGAGGLTASSPGTTNTIAKFSGANTVVDSSITDNGSVVTIGSPLVASTSISTSLLQSSGALTITPGSTFTAGALNQQFVIQGTSASQIVGQSGSFAATLGFTTPTANRNILLPNESGTLCLQNSVNCGFAISGSGVTSVNAQTGAVVINNAVGSAGQITINDAAANGSTKGIAAFNSTNFSAASGVINTIQGISTTASPQFANLNVSTAGTLSVNNIAQTAPGQNLSINAGSDTITFVANGISFILPSTGPGAQTICTTGISCVAGGGQAIELAPGVAQLDNTTDSSIFINKTNTGNIVQLQTSGVDTFVLNSSGLLNVNSIASVSGALTIGDTTEQLVLQGDGTSVLSATTGSDVTLVGFSGTPSTGTVRYNFARDPSGGAGTYTVCTTDGNCAGLSGSVSTPGGTTGFIPKFTGSQILGNSIISESGSAITINNGSLLVQGTNGVILGLSSTNDGRIDFKNSTNANTVTLQSGVTASDYSLTLPTADGVASQCIKTDGSGQLIFGDCLSGAGGGGGVASLNGNSGVVVIQGTTNQVNVTSSGVNPIVLSLPQNIATTSDPTFRTINLTGTVSAGLRVGSVGALGRIVISDGDASEQTVTFVSATLSGDKTITIPNFTGSTATLPVTASGFIAIDASGNISTSGLLPIASGGTGSGTAAGARTNLGAAQSGTNSDITSTTALNTITPSGSLNIGALAQTFTLQGDASSVIRATDSGVTNSIVFATPTGGAKTITIPNLSGTVCLLEAGNCLGGAGGANTSLSNLSSVAINTSLLAGSTSIDLGSSSAPFRDLYVGGTATNNFRFTGTATSGRTFTLPDASGTLAVSASGNVALSAAGNISLTGQIPIASGGTGASTAQTGINNLAGLTTNGDILYFNGTNSVRLGRGSDGQCLVSSPTSIVWTTCTGDGVGVTTVGSLDGGTPSADGANISGSIIYMQSADVTRAGLINTGTQTFAGVKTFNGAVTFASGITIGASQTITIGGDAISDLSGTGLQVVGGSLETTLGVSVDLASEVNGVLPILNGGTGASTAQGAINAISGLTTNGDLLYYNGTNSTRLARGSDTQCLISTSTTIEWNTCTGDGVGVTTLSAIGASPNANGATISGNTLNLQPASASFGGVVTTGTQTFAGAKTFNDSLTITGQVLSVGNNFNDPIISLSPSATGNSFIDFNNNNGADYIRFNNDTDTFSLVANGNNVFNGLYNSFQVTPDATFSNTLGVDGLATFNSNIRISDGSSNFATIAVQSTAGDYTYTIPTTTANDTFCLATLGNCAGSNIFTDGGSFSYLTTSTDELVIGGTTSLGAKLAVVGTADQTQLLVRANSTQTSPLIVAQNSAGAELFRLNSDGTSIFLGRNAGANDDGSNESTGIGDGALAAQTSATYNVALGRNALNVATTQGQNVAIGTFALLGFNGTGGSNTAVGHSSMVFSTAGWNNTALGASTLRSNTGNDNVALGVNSLQDKVAGNGNIAIGHSAGSNLTSGSNNIIIGPYLGFANTTGSNQLNIAGILTSTNYTNGNLVVGTSDTTGQLLVLDTKTDSGDPTGVNGGMYYNSDAGKFRCYEDGSWVDCIGSGINALAAIGSSPNANGATITGNTLNLQPASASFGGVVTTGTQTFAGAKTFNDGISSPGAGLNSERFGAGAVAGGDESLAVGYQASSAGFLGVALGYQSSASAAQATAVGGGASANQTFSVALGSSSAVGGSQGSAIGSYAFANTSGTALGYSSDASGSFSTAIGTNATSSGDYSIALGIDSNTASFNRSITIGSQSFATANNQLVVGDDNGWMGAYITEAYLGAGVTSANAASRDIRLQATGGLGTNIGGADFTLAGGRGTGSAAGGSLLFQTSAAGSSGTTLRNLSTVLTLAGGTGAATFQNTTNSTSAFRVQNAAGNNLLGIDTTNNYVDILSNNNRDFGPWTNNATALPAARINYQGAYSNGYIYVMGGYNGAFAPQTGIYFAQPNADGTISSWTTATNSLPSGRAEGTGVALNGYLYVIGGGDFGGNSTVYYSQVGSAGQPGTWNTTTALPSARYGHMSFSYGNRIYVLGGVDHDDVWYATQNSDGTLSSWTQQTAQLPTNRARAGVTVNNGYVYMVGGKNGISTFDTVYYTTINPDGSLNSWTATTSNPASNACIGVKAVNGYLYSMGGASADCNTASPGQYFYAPINANGSLGSWITSSNPPAGEVHRYDAIVVGNRAYNIGGGTNQTRVRISTIGGALRVGGSLDLVGINGALSANGGTYDGSLGGDIRAGSIETIGGIKIGGTTNIGGQLTVLGASSFSGQALFQSSSNSATAFQVQNASGTSILTVDTSASTILSGGSILPTADDAYDLGSSTNRWRDLYLGPASLHIGEDGDEGVLSYDTTNNNFYFNKSINVVSDGYLNFGLGAGSAGYGIRDNNGVLEVKDLGGSWLSFSSLLSGQGGGGGGGSSGSLSPIPQIESSTTAVGAVENSLSINIPAGTQDGDLLIMQMITYDQYSSDSPTTIPSGWNWFASIDTPYDFGAGNMEMNLFYRIASGDTPGTSRTWSHPQNHAYISGNMLRISGANPIQPIHKTVYRDNTNDVNPGYAAMTTDIANTLGLGFLLPGDEDPLSIPNWTNYTQTNTWIDRRDLPSATTYAAEESAVTETWRYLSTVIAVAPAEQTGQYAGVALLQDDFNDNLIDAAKWNDSILSGGSVTETGQQLALGLGTNTSSEARLTSDITYNLTSKWAGVQFISETSTYNNYALMQLDDGVGVVGWQFASNGNITAYEGSTALWTGTAGGANAFVRIREAVGLTYWETSSDGETWTTRHGVTSPIDMSDVSVTMLAENAAGVAGSSTYTFDNLYVGTSDQTINFNPTNYVVLQGGNDLGTNLAVGTLDNYNLALMTGSQEVAVFNGVDGSVIFRNRSNSTTAFQVRAADETPILTVDTANARLLVGGNVGLGLDTADTASAVCLNSSGNLATCTSSSKFKDDVTDLSLGLDELRQLQPVSYTWNTTGQADVGFIAEQVASVIPQAVTYDANGEVSSFNYNTISALLVSSVKELDLKVTAIETRLASVEAGNFAGNIKVGGKFISTGNKPEVLAVSTGQVNGVAVNVNGTDVAGSVNIQTGAGTPGDLTVKITFDTPYSGGVPVATVSAVGKQTSDLGVYIVSVNNNEMVIGFSNPPADQKAYTINYQIIQAVSSN